MRTRSFFIVLVSCFILIHSFSAQAQRIVFWKGGTPGLESAWNCPKNWSNHAVPDEFSNVIIPDVSTRSGKYPVISKKDAVVNFLTLQAGASLTISKNGALNIQTGFERHGVQQLKVEGGMILHFDYAAKNAKKQDKTPILAVSGSNF
jgi:hypothetical protein